MANIKITLENIEEFDKYINFIEENLYLKSSKLIDKMAKEFNKTPKQIRINFEKIYNSDEFITSLSNYIKRRQNEKNMLQNSNTVDCENTYDTTYITKQVEQADIINKYNLCKLKVDKKGYHISDLNYTKVLNATFKDEIFIYFPSDEQQNIVDIIYFNEKFLSKEKIDIHTLKDKFNKFEVFYTKESLEINNIIYFKNDRSWMQNISQELDYWRAYLKIDLNLLKYNTIFNKTKDFLRIVMKINNEEINYKYKGYLNIRTEEDVEKHYRESVEIIYSILNPDVAYHHIYWEVFYKILKCENGKLTEDISEGPYFKIIYERAILYLLICGYIYMKE